MELKKRPRLNAGAAISIAMLSIAMWLSGKQPFIPNTVFIEVLIFGGTPIIFLFIIYHIFFQKDKCTGLTTYQAKMLVYNSLGKRILWHIAAAPILLGVSLLFSFMSQWYPAWPTKVFSSQERKVEVQVNKIIFNRKLGIPRLHLTNVETEQTYKLFWPQDRPPKSIQPGDILQIQTKHSWFGDYVIHITKPDAE